MNVKTNQNKAKQNKTKKQKQKTFLLEICLLYFSTSLHDVACTWGWGGVGGWWYSHMSAEYHLPANRPPF